MMKFSISWYNSTKTNALLLSTAVFVVDGWYYIISLVGSSGGTMPPAAFEILFRPMTILVVAECSNKAWNLTN